MKTAQIQDLAAQADELARTTESVIVVDGDRTIGVFHPLPDPCDLPIEVRRERFAESAKKIHAQLDALGISDEQIERDIATLRQNRG